MFHWFFTTAILQKGRLLWKWRVDINLDSYMSHYWGYSFGNTLILSVDNRSYRELVDISLAHFGNFGPLTTSLRAIIAQSEVMCEKVWSYPLWTLQLQSLLLNTKYDEICSKLTYIAQNVLLVFESLWWSVWNYEKTLKPKISFPDVSVDTWKFQSRILLPVL